MAFSVALGICVKVSDLGSLGRGNLIPYCLTFPYNSIALFYVFYAAEPNPDLNV
jgi:hypothetical protein